jgi:hypothetical protein
MLGYAFFVEHVVPPWRSFYPVKKSGCHVTAEQLICHEWLQLAFGMSDSNPISGYAEAVPEDIKGKIIRNYRISG